MRVVAMLVLLAVLAGGLGAAYVVYTQSQTKTVALAASPAWVPRDDGALCTTAEFTVDARTTGVWYVPSGEGATIAGTMAVGGSADRDLRLRVYSPSNRTVFRQDGAVHELTFEVAADVRGDYRFELDNRHSAFTAKDVTLSLCVG